MLIQWRNAELQAGRANKAGKTLVFKEKFYVFGPSVFYAPLGLGFRVRLRLRVRSVISVSFRVRVMVSADIW